jgi:molybdate transport system substrate-binding protein
MRRDGRRVSPPKRAWWAAVLFLTLLPGCQRQPAPGKLLLYCGAGLRAPVAEIALEFGRQEGVVVECDYAGSELLLNRAKLSGQGDLYLPGDLHYVEQASQAGLLATSRNVCYLVPVILVRPGNPKHIQGLEDLTRPGVRLGLGDAEACAIGRQSQMLFAKNHIGDAQLQPNVVMRALTVNQLGNSVKLKALDAAIVWDAVAASYAGQAETVAIPLEQNVVSRVPAGILKSSPQPALAAKFLEFIASPRGAAIFRKHHYATELPH